MVGGLADWFAVTALFRHPLGLPIPHTAIVVERKDQFADTLGQFIQESFLTPDVIVERVRGGRGGGSPVADWLSHPEHAARAAAEISLGLGVVLRLRARRGGAAQPGDGGAASGSTRWRWRRWPGGRWSSSPPTDATTRSSTPRCAGLDRYLGEHGDELRDRIGPESPWWLPGRGRGPDLRAPAGRRPAPCCRHGRRSRPPAAPHVRPAPGRPGRRPAALARAGRARGEQLKHDLLEPARGAPVGELAVAGPEGSLQAQIDDPASPLRDRLAEMLIDLGHRLATDPALRLDGGSRPWPTRRASPRPASTGRSPTWSAGPSPDGTRPRRRVDWSCCSAPTCSSSGSTARSSAPWPAWPCTRWPS